MRLILTQECDYPGGMTPPPGRYGELVEEARLAEALGFSAYSVSEQHFNKSIATISAPETFLAFIAAKTDTIRIRVTSFVLSFNNPLRVAERTATLDVLSGGRFELGTARSNNPRTLEAFGIKPDQTRAAWDESLTVIRKALSEDTFEHAGELWQIPELSIMPRPLQKPHPPIHVSATSIETHRNAGKRGIGMMTGNSLPGGWAYLEEAVAAYRDGQKDADVGPGTLTDSTGALAALAYCAPTKEEAFDVGREPAMRFVLEVANWYERLAKESTDYAAMGPLKELVDRREDLDHLVARAPYLTIGTPDFFVERCERLAALGYEEFILRIDGMEHERNLATIELIGKEVLPRVEGLKAARPSGSGPAS